MARQATIVGTIADAWGDLWDIREYRQASYGQLAIGWPAGQRGKGYGGPRVIITPRLKRYMDDHQLRGAMQVMERELPIAKSTITRLRRILGHDSRISQREWWMDRADDLLMLTGREFSERYGVCESTASIARSTIFGVTRQRPDGWWRNEPYRSTLLSAQPNAMIADTLSISAGAVGRLRGALLRADGQAPNDIRQSGIDKMARTKRGAR